MKLKKIFTQDGPIAQAIDGYQVRQGQVDLASAIAECVVQPNVLVAEAGTGIGKTFAYLAPLLNAGKKAIISTGTKNLQDQLFHRDLPLVRKVLMSSGKLALLKGRSNYLCWYRLDHHYHHGQFNSRDLITQLTTIKNWAAATKMGDMAEIPDVSEQSPIWPYVTSTQDNCLGSECPFVKQCFVFKARKRALAADVVIINHHLFFADLALKDEGMGELLPNVDVVVFDEAHLLPDIARNFLSTRFSSRQLVLLLQELISELQREAIDPRDLEPIINQLHQKLTELNESLKATKNKDVWPPPQKGEWQSALVVIAEGLRGLCETMQQLGSNSEGLSQCQMRCQQFIGAINQISQQTDQSLVLWYEQFKASFVIYATPLSVASAIRELLYPLERSWIFTSATLSVDQGFGYITEQLGLTEATTVQFESPFDYQNNSLLYHPRYLPDPNDASYTQEVAQTARAVITVAGGRTFCLFTSYRAMHEVAEQLSGKIDHPLLIQGTQPKEQLLSRFRQLGNAVLLATMSFWQGVDVRGEALSCVIIDRLPFVVPSDPVVSARIAVLKKQGREPFNDFQIPEAIITLKQGVGRLIRDVCDRGVLVICDPRLVARDYAKLFFNSLPNMPLTRDFDNVKKFFND